jgi:hypothetical protein
MASVELFSVLVDAKRLSAGLFRQFEAIPFCDVNGSKNPDLSQVGVVRYNIAGHSLWAVALHKGRLVRCSLITYRTADVVFSENILRLTRDLSGHGVSSAFLRSYWEKSLQDTKMSRNAEPIRHAAHIEAAAMEQLFLSLR